MFSLVVKFFGFAVVLHAAWSVAQLRSSLDEVISQPPPQIYAQVVMGFLIALLGTIWQMPTLGEVRGNRDWRNPGSFVPPPPSWRTRDFDIFTHVN
mmetsp:Transcript_21295/g.44432  ORF Transcript_21295/g.44432 Transcript_21295/m.44432 type:complete len:96 (+) Transcript_21295:24-311(+)